MRPQPCPTRSAAPPSLDNREPAAISHRYELQVAASGSAARDGFWEALEVGHIAWFHPNSSAHRPRTCFRLALCDDHLHVRFDVADRYVRSKRTVCGSDVCRDSCVELFVQPRGGEGYFNIEVNAGGTLHVGYVRPRLSLPQRFTVMSPDELRGLTVRSTLPAVIDPEISEPIEWSLTLAMPLDIMRRYVGPLDDPRQTPWRANLYKCASDLSHPHWACWHPIGERLNFHQPEYFGWLQGR